MKTTELQYVRAGSGALLGTEKQVEAKLGQVGVRPKATKTPAQSYHKGYIVVGYPAGTLADAEKAHNESRAQWLAMTPEQLNKATSLGNREPKPWELGVWLRSHAPSRLRRRPFESHEAAIDCKRAAESQGWECVEIIEQKKGVAPPVGLF